jgi:two-component system chemotaxis sensor kinase CheA
MDLTPFLEAFHAECQEALDSMESSLLKLERGEPEAIHDIFRAAHSIKGGAATFGMDAVTDFTHCCETLLDLMRSGSYTADAETIALLLEATDCIRNLLQATQDGNTVDADRVAAVRARLDTALKAAENGGTAAPEGTAEDQAEGPVTWSITFYPMPDMLTSGNDPVGMFAELADLGALSAVPDLSELPQLENMNPERCYLGWSLELVATGVSREQVAAAFEWVEDECELTITCNGPAAAADEAAEPPEASAVNEPSAQAASEAAPAQANAVSADEGTAGGDGKSATTASAAPATRTAESSSIRVDTGKIDQMINMVGELVITQSMLTQVGGELDESADGKRIERLREGLSQLERNTRELQESIMAIRMVPISFAFNRLPRLVHDVSAKLDKRAELTISGEQTEIDKTLIEKIGDPLVHMVRNAVDHGIESPADRREAGKPETGQLHIEAVHKGGNVVIEIRDDGRGLNSDKILAKARERGVVSAEAKLSESQIFDLIFAPGFSTSDEVSDLSGRGVGMDVVRSNILELGGDTELESKLGEGTVVRIILPLTLAILDGQAIRVADELYVIPLVSILESIQLAHADIRSPAGAFELVYWREEYLPLIRLDRVLQTPESQTAESRGLVVIVEGGGHRAGLVVDDLLAQQQVVIKSLEENFQRVEGFSGATILGDGSVSMIIDVAGLIKLAGRCVAAGGATHKDQARCRPETTTSPA